MTVADASFLINFLCLDRMGLLGVLRHVFCVPNHVAAEVRRAEQRVRLRAAVEAGILTELGIVDQGEIALYVGFRRYLGDGESACLAVAVARRWAIAADEKGRFRREVFTHLGEAYLLNTPGALVSALRAGALSVAEAEGIRQELARRRFVMKVPPFAELLG